MPGKDYGSAGKWVHDRAHRILEDNPETPKGMAYALATQQGHKVGKTPKDFRTAGGVREAKQKYDAPKSEYQKTAEDMRKQILRNFEGQSKTAMLHGFFDELQKIGQSATDVFGSGGVPGGGDPMGGSGGGGSGGMPSGGLSGGAGATPPPPPPPSADMGGGGGPAPNATAAGRMGASQAAGTQMLGAMGTGGGGGSENAYRGPSGAGS